jgi:hypothetical protein
VCSTDAVRILLSGSASPWGSVARMAACQSTAPSHHGAQPRARTGTKGREADLILWGSLRLYKLDVC